MRKIWFYLRSTATILQKKKKTKSSSKSLPTSLSVVARFLRASKSNSIECLRWFVLFLAISFRVCVFRMLRWPFLTFFFFSSMRRRSAANHTSSLKTYIYLLILDGCDTIVRSTIVCVSRKTIQKLANKNGSVIRTYVFDQFHWPWFWLSLRMYASRSICGISKKTVFSRAGAAFAANGVCKRSRRNTWTAKQ